MNTDIKELAIISRKFLGINKIYKYGDVKISQMNNDEIIATCYKYCEENGLINEFNKFKNQNNLLLSADGDIGLYHVEKQILDNLEELIGEFYNTKKTNLFNETLFVKFLKKKLGENSIYFVKNVDPDEIDEEYKGAIWYNF